MRSLGTGVTGGCELHDPVLGIRLGPLEEQHLLLPTEQLLCPSFCF